MQHPLMKPNQDRSKVVYNIEKNSKNYF